MSHTFDEMTANSPVAQFYEDRSVFITGATGFMGKVLVEKLLRSTNVSKLYLLIRPKKGVSTENRLQDLMSSRIFDGLRNSRPAQLTKVQAVNGDITFQRLGLGEQEEELLVNNVSVVFHSAATVKFDEDLSKAVAMNVESVQSIINLCKRMKKLEALVHVSTAYCNCDLTEIKEEIYPPPGSPQGMIQLCKTMDEATLNSPEITAKLIGNRPNTYTFTKALAENLLLTEGAGLPISIVRPSIVSAAWKEPLPGWVDNLNGPSGMLAGAGKGILRTMFCKREMRADLVPVDIPINLMCCVAWRTATRATKKIQVYNCTSSALNPFLWGEFETLGIATVIKHPFSQIFWYPGGSMKSSDLMNKICQTVQQRWPAYLFDTVAWLTNNKPYMVKVNKMMQKSTQALEYFTTNEWEWTNERTVGLQKELTEGDRTLFNFDVSQLNWPEYIESYVKGVKRFVFKEDDSSISASKRLLNRMFWLEKGVQMVVVVIVVLLYRTEMAGRMWNFLLSLLSRFFS